MESFINGFFGALQTLLSWLLDGVLYVLKTVVWFTLNGFFTVITTFVQALDIGSHITTMAGYFGLLPPQVIYLLNALGIPSCLSILAWAYGIRMLLNLIPAAFTRI